jgi:hypothetical protein
MALGVAHADRTAGESVAANATGEAASPNRPSTAASAAMRKAFIEMGIRRQYVASLRARRATRLARGADHSSVGLRPDPSGTQGRPVLGHPRTSIVEVPAVKDLGKVEQVGSEHGMVALRNSPRFATSIPQVGMVKSGDRLPKFLGLLAVALSFGSQDSHEAHLPLPSKGNRRACPLRRDGG